MSAKFRMAAPTARITTAVMKGIWPKRFFGLEGSDDWVWVILPPAEAAVDQKVLGNSAAESAFCDRSGESTGAAVNWAGAEKTTMAAERAWASALAVQRAAAWVARLPRA